MNEKLKKVFEILQKSNFITEIDWVHIYGEHTDEDQKVFTDWMDKNELVIRPGQGALVFCDKNGNAIKDMKKYCPLSEPLPEKRRLNSTTIYSTEFCDELPIGWLAPDGTLIECDWGDHEGLAYEIVCEKDLRNEVEIFHKQTGSYYSRDFLIFKLKYILLDNPSGDGTLQITYNKDSRLTKLQKDFIVDYLMKVEDKVNLERFVEEQCN